MTTHDQDTGEHAEAAIEHRYQGVRGLQPGDTDAVERLLEYLGDPSWRVRRAALGAVDRLALQPTLVSSLIAGLTSGRTSASTVLAPMLCVDLVREWWMRFWWRLPAPMPTNVSISSRSLGASVPPKRGKPFWTRRMIRTRTFEARLLKPGFCRGAAGDRALEGSPERESG